MNMRTSKQRGFTLVELAIVLIVISLVVGGIVAGRTLVRNAELRSITSESENLIRATKQFVDKYQAMPGDFYKASSYWSGVSDGDGTGFIECGFISGLEEEFFAWSHLSAAKFIEGSFTGATGSPAVSDRIPGTNIPASSASGAGWGMVYIGKTLADNMSTSNVHYIVNNEPPLHVLWFGGRSTSGASNEMTAVLTAEEAEQIDIKLDNGIPGTGKIMAQYNVDVGPSSCATDNGGAAYNVSTTGRICALIFRMGF